MVDIDVKQEIIEGICDVLREASRAEVFARQLTRVVIQSCHVFFETWMYCLRTILDAARRIEHENARYILASLLAAIAQQSVATNESEEDCYYKDVSGQEYIVKAGQSFTFSDHAYWIDLPWLGMLMRDLWNGQSTRFSAPVIYLSMDTGPDQRMTQEVAIRQWSNVNEFCAHLVVFGYQRDIKVLQKYDIYAIWTLRTALESPSTEDDFSPSRPASRPSETPTHGHNHASAMAVVHWIEIAGSLIKGWNTQLEGRERAARPGPFFRGSPGFSPRRWDFWKSRILALSESSEVDTYMSKRLKGAALTM